MNVQMLKFPLFVVCTLCAAAFPATAQAPSTSTGQAPAQLGASLDEHMRRLVPFGFSGVLLVVKDGQVIARGGYGLADRESRRPFTPETPFYIGSLTKQFTAAGILKLEMEGKLRVTDSIGRFLPSVPADKRGITLHQLMTHTAGLAIDPPAGLDAPRDRDAVVREILAAPLSGSPGGAYSYSNMGYVLLAAVIERAAETPYERYLRERLWTPAGMANTGYRPRRMEEAAVGYRGGSRWGTAAERHPFPDGPTWSIRGAGGMISTLDDMHRWSRALDGEGVLSAAARQKLWTPHVPQHRDDQSPRYGYGWVVARTARGTGIVSHNGSNGIHYAEMRRYPDENVLVIAASNVAEFMADVALPGVSRLTFGLPYTPPPAAGAPDPARAAAAAGTYRLPGGGTITARAEDGELRLTTNGADAYAAVRGTAPSPEADSAAARTVAVLDAAGRGDFAPLHRAVGGEMPLEALRQMFLDNLAAHGVGAVRVVELVGARARPGGAVAVARLRGEGEMLLEMSWRDERVVGIDVVQDAGPSRFVPAPDGGWVSYEPSSGAAVRLRTDGGVMQIETSTGPVRAPRS